MNNDTHVVETTKTPHPVVKCSHLSKNYQDGGTQIDVLRDISLTVQRGESVAIVGTSGSGKSTLLHLLGGLDRPSAGDVWVAGKKIASLAERAKAKLRNHALGFVYQFHHLLPEFTAIENVAMPLLIRGLLPKMCLAKAEKILASVGLAERLAHKPGELSGGERQRVAIARALVTDPLCILADEPTGNLDPQNAQNVLNLFLELQKAHGMALIMVTHDKEIAAQASRTVLLEAGSLQGL